MRKLFRGSSHGRGVSQKERLASPVTERKSPPTLARRVPCAERGNLVDLDKHECGRNEGRAWLDVTRIMVATRSSNSASAG